MSYNKPVLMLNELNPEAGEGAESARADFNLRELPCYLRNTYEMFSLLLRFRNIFLSSV